MYALSLGITGSVCDDIAQAVVDLTSENDELRKIIRELENDFAQSRVAQVFLHFSFWVGMKILRSVFLKNMFAF